MYSLTHTQNTSCKPTHRQHDVCPWEMWQKFILLCKVLMCIDYFFCLYDVFWVCYRHQLMHWNDTFKSYWCICTQFLSLYIKSLKQSTFKDAKAFMFPFPFIHVFQRHPAAAVQLQGDGDPAGHGGDGVGRSQGWRANLRHLPQDQVRRWLWAPVLVLPDQVLRPLRGKSLPEIQHGERGRGGCEDGLRCNVLRKVLMFSYGQLLWFIHILWKTHRWICRVTAKSCKTRNKCRES